MALKLVYGANSSILFFKNEAKVLSCLTDFTFVVQLVNATMLFYGLIQFVYENKQAFSRLISPFSGLHGTCYMLKHLFPEIVP